MGSMKPLVCISAYDYATALSAGRAGGIDVVFVLAQEVAQCALGLESAAADMIRHTCAVARGVNTHGSSPDPIVIAELPLGSYEASPEHALSSALAVLKAYPPAATGVLICGGKEMVLYISKLSDAGILSIVRLGVSSASRRSQSVFAKSGGEEEADFVARSFDSAKELLADTQALDAAGVAAVVLEGVAAAAAQKLTGVLTAPVVGMGCGTDCAGQLVLQSEMLGLRIGERQWSRYHKKYEIVAERSWREMKQGEDVQFRQMVTRST
ncbi:Phosphoenolpyruvate/pyruvate domain-containing protein [Wilcoxina mikolae CBS 423.85]|nr:Phosphoenolpyruvate/pyruvate domain-containing protein [Wilcoxina mikolae CBS 423.85]